MRARHALSVRHLMIALAFLLVCQGGAVLAAEFAPPKDADLPDAISGPSADRVPPGLACTDNMDFSPEDSMRSPFDADLVAFRPHRETQPAAKPAASETCGGRARIDRA